MTASKAGLETDATENDSFPRQELISALMVVGFVLLFFPEPVTSVLGVVLVTLGGGLWVRDLLRQPGQSIQ
ncbi:hypothetical protein NGM10_06480 [Halorussus salilacus]|uniref:hypothetical protein n=1 Tax=Halorussus salilacus TaxID=2953750 RepID=UPI00209EFAC3|nr:hypothetical protein [Halorussus salilacus]USZ69376.1 hypothetical protein NGM10_06480 [Halorussus salilacus]